MRDLGNIFEVTWKHADCQGRGDGPLLGSGDPLLQASDKVGWEPRADELLSLRVNTSEPNLGTPVDVVYEEKNILIFLSRDSQKNLS